MRTDENSLVWCKPPLASKEERYTGALHIRSTNVTRDEIRIFGVRLPLTTILIVCPPKSWNSLTKMTQSHPRLTFQGPQIDGPCAERVNVRLTQAGDGQAGD